MNQEEIYQLIVKFEERAGESFLDQGFHLNELTFMTWCYGKSYINQEKYNEWSKCYRKGYLEATDANYYVYCSDGNQDAPFAVIISEDWNKEDQEKAYRILAEFISGIDIYIERFKKYVKEES